MVLCSKCNNETRTASLLSPMGEITVSGPGGSEPLPISAQVCVACGHIDLYAPQYFEQPQVEEQRERLVPIEDILTSGVPVA